MTLHFLPVDEDPAPIRLAEPPIVALPGADLTVWRVVGGFALRIGSATEIGVATIEIPSELLTSVWMTLRSVDEETGS